MREQRGTAGFQQTLSTPDENFMSVHRGAGMGQLPQGQVMTTSSECSNSVERCEDPATVGTLAAGGLGGTFDR